MPLEIPPNGVGEFEVILKVSMRGHEFNDEATIYLEDNGRLREYKLAVKGMATPELESSEE